MANSNKIMLSFSDTFTHFTALGDGLQLSYHSLCRDNRKVMTKILGSSQDEEDQQWMLHALRLAKEAEAAGEVPVGAVLVLDGKIIGEGWNQPIQSTDPSAHAEMMAMRAGAKYLNNYRLVNTTLYVTLEPCAMCAGAMIHARIQRLVFGALDPKTGAAGSVFNLLQDKRLNHRVKCEGGVMEEVCGKLLKSFFKSKR